MTQTDHAHVETEIEREVEAEQEQTRLAFAGLWTVLGVLAVVIIGTFLIISRHAHTPALSPGQPQKPAVAALITGGGG
ncbi:MAG TPA: hypothetical protein VE309_06110 [Caulobacteraceae bacterium]|nr:hypothetical protein [Caulobacteraceae bacterium]